MDLQGWMDYWAEVWGVALERALEVQWVALYGRGALCEGMGV